MMRLIVKSILGFLNFSAVRNMFPIPGASTDRFQMLVESNRLTGCHFGK
jgi:hypothetical protein